jgi:DNA-binding NarL/FixJ family response regulator
MAGQDSETSAGCAAVRVVIADDHAIVRTGLRRVLERLRYEVVDEAEDGFQAIAAIKATSPDLVLLDISMPLAQGTEVVHEIRRWSPGTKIVVYTAVTRAAALAALIETGVDGLFAKGGSVDELQAQLPLIMQDSHYIAGEITDILGQPSPIEQLTAREAQIMNMLLAGKSNKDIADQLSISPKTVDKHRTNLMAKLGLHSFADLMHYALTHELIGAQSGDI